MNNIKLFIAKKKISKFIILLSLLCTSVYAENLSLKKIHELQNIILSENTKLSRLELELKALDSQISEKSQDLQKLNNIITKIMNAKLDLQRKKTTQFDALYFQKQQLIKQLKSSYVIQRNNNVQKLAHINNLQQLHRLLNYLESINTSSVAQIKAIKDSIGQLEELDNNLNLLNIKQQQYKQQIAVAYNNLKDLKDNNLQLKQQLLLSLGQNKAKLTSYQTRYNSLNNFSNNPIYKEATINSKSLFNRAKGTLALPVNGIIDHDFKNIDQRQAIFIKTKEGQQVRSVFDGQVVFSNWLRGFGFLTIVNHKDGFMSLYGHNQTLLKKSGDIVKTGEVLALTGASGSTEEPGLYFEIRHNGNTVNPLAWLKNDTNKAIV